MGIAPKSHPKGFSGQLDWLLEMFPFCWIYSVYDIILYVNIYIYIYIQCAHMCVYICEHGYWRVCEHIYVLGKAQIMASHRRFSPGMGHGGLEVILDCSIQLLLPQSWRISKCWDLTLHVTGWNLIPPHTCWFCCGCTHCQVALWWGWCWRRYQSSWEGLAGCWDPFSSLGYTRQPSIGCLMLRSPCFSQESIYHFGWIRYVAAAECGCPTIGPILRFVLAFAACRTKTLMLNNSLPSNFLCPASQLRRIWNGVVSLCSDLWRPSKSATCMLVY